MKHAQICILSGQSLPNLLPLLQHQPNKVIFAASKEMIKNKEKIISSLRSHGLEDLANNTVTLNEMPDHNFTELSLWAEKEIAGLKETLPDYTFSLNQTGGTKLMSQALVEACKKQNIPIPVFYCDTSNDHIEWISPEIKLEPIKINLLDSKTILHAQGINIEEAESDSFDWKETANARKPLTEHLAKNAGQPHGLSYFIGDLNRTLHEHLNNKKVQFPATAKFKYRLHNNVSRKTMQLFADHGLITLLKPLSEFKPPEFEIHSMDALRYLGGTWLEEYLWHCMVDAGFEDIYCSMKFKDSLDNSGSEKTNELDIVASHRNRALLIECKTASFTELKKYNDSVAKLDSLGRRAAGLLANRWLVIARWPYIDLDRQAYILNLARAHNITVVEPRHIAGLTNRIKEWKETLKFPLQDKSKK